MYEKYVELRSVKGIKSDNAFAEKSGISKSIISDWKNGNSVPDTSTLYKIFNYLDYTLSVTPIDKDKEQYHVVTDFEYQMVLAFRKQKADAQNVILKSLGMGNDEVEANDEAEKIMKAQKKKATSSKPDSTREAK